MPAIIDHPVGAGRVLVFNTTANADWSDLPRQSSFVTLLDQMLTYLSAGGLKRSFTVGDAVALPLADFQAGNEVSVVTPGGARLSPRLRSTRGQTLMYLDNVAEAGVYRVDGAGGGKFAFVVNASRTDSPLSPMDAEALKAWWGPSHLEIIERRRRRLPSGASSKSMAPVARARDRRGIVSVGRNHLRTSPLPPPTQSLPRGSSRRAVRRKVMQPRINLARQSRNSSRQKNKGAKK